MYLGIDGGHRVKACLELIDEKFLPANFVVPCIVFTLDMPVGLCQILGSHLNETNETMVRQSFTDKLSLFQHLFALADSDNLSCQDCVAHCSTEQGASAGMTYESLKKVFRAFQSLSGKDFPTMEKPWMRYVMRGCGCVCACWGGWVAHTIYIAVDRVLCTAVLLLPRCARRT
jgi:hypothetical protein